jgi:hypothetical protein
MRSTHSAGRGSAARHGAERRRSPERGRYEPIAVYHLAARLKASGIDLDRATGPWRVRERGVARPGRTGLHAMAVVTNESTEVLVDTREHAVDVAGLLNWCGVHDLEPVPELTPPTF